MDILAVWLVIAYHSIAHFAIHLWTFVAATSTAVGQQPVSQEGIRGELVWSYVIASVVALIQRSSNQAVQWISHNTPWVTRLVMAIGASLHAMGVAWTFHEGTLTVTGISLTAIVAFVLAAAKNYVLQHWLYQTAWRTREQFRPSPSQPAPAPTRG